MRLVPFDAPDELNEVLADHGVLDASETTEAKEELSHIQRIFKRAGAGINDSAVRIAELMDSKEANVALRATETALKIQGVFIEEKKKSVPVININIIGSTGEQRNLINLVMPTVQ